MRLRLLPSTPVAQPRVLPPRLCFRGPLRSPDRAWTAARRFHRRHRVALESEAEPEEDAGPAPGEEDWVELRSKEDLYREFEQLLKGQTWDFQEGDVVSACVAFRMHASRGMKLVGHGAGVRSRRGCAAHRLDFPWRGGSPGPRHTASPCRWKASSRPTIPLACTWKSIPRAPRFVPRRRWRWASSPRHAPLGAGREGRDVPAERTGKGEMSLLN